MNNNQYPTLNKNGFLENVNPPYYKRPRIWELDFVRGLCILLMIIDHTLYLGAYTFGSAWFGFYPVAGSSGWADFTIFARWWWNCPERAVIHQIVLFLFFSVSGVSCYFSRNNLKRGAELGILAIVYSLVTLYVQDNMGMSGMFVHFGVLHLLCVCVFIFLGITSLVKLLTKNRKPAAGKWISTAVFFLLTLTIVLLYFFYYPPKTTPKALFFIFWHEPSNYLVEHGASRIGFFTQYEMSPGDFFPIIPFAAYFFAGTFLAPILYGKRKSLFPALDRAWHKPVTIIGKHTLIIYLLHLVALTLLFALLSYLFASPGNWVIF